jgi:hypothetical protein
MQNAWVASPCIVLAARGGSRYNGRMTKRLQEAIKLAELLPPEKQDRLAGMVIDEIEADRGWDERFAATPDQLERLANEAVERDKQGGSKEQGWDEL